MLNTGRVSCTTRWQYQYGDGEEETGSDWFTGGDTENIAADIDAKLDDRNWHIDSLSETPRTTISEQQIQQLELEGTLEDHCSGLSGPACIDSENCEWVDQHICEPAEDPDIQGWQLTTHQPDPSDVFDEDEAWQNFEIERDDYDPSEDSRSVEAIMCRMSRWLPIESTGCQ